MIRRILNGVDWQYSGIVSPHVSVWEGRHSRLTWSTRLLWGKLNCCKVFGSTKCLQQVSEGQRFIVCFSQHPEDVKWRFLLISDTLLNTVHGVARLILTISGPWCPRLYKWGSWDTEILRSLLKTMEGGSKGQSWTSSQVVWHHPHPALPVRARKPCGIWIVTYMSSNPYSTTYWLCCPRQGF